MDKVVIVIGAIAILALALSVYNLSNKSEPYVNTTCVSECQRNACVGEDAGPACMVECERVCHGLGAVGTSPNIKIGVE